jgi:transcriptional regulator with XRE-family HTH domain
VLRACGRVGVDVDAASAAFLPACAPALRTGTRFHVDRWLSSLRGSLKVTALAARSGYSRYAIARWLHGQAQPRLPDFLALVEAITARASDLVQQLVPIDAVPELRAVHARRAAAKRVAFDVPWSEAALRVMETTGYRRTASHRPGYIAERLEITLEEEREVLRALEAAGILRRERDRYLDIEPMTVETDAPAHDRNPLKAHWTQVCARRLTAPRPSDWLGYNVISTSAADITRIRDVLQRAFREIRAIAAASVPIESVALLNLQLVTWDDDGAPSPRGQES